MKVGLLLSGCGVQDGSEIFEAVLSILALERAGVAIVAMAPDISQTAIVNHYSGDEERMATRNVLAESARIVRGKITSVGEVSSHDIDALIIPGGFGVVRNLCTYAADGLDAKVNTDVERLIQQLHGLGKPIGAMCVGPVLVALALRDKQVQLTVGNDGKVGNDLTRLGARTVVTAIDDIHIDPKNNIVSTAAFMLAENATQAVPGISRLVSATLDLARAMGPGHDDDESRQKVHNAGVPS